jgi:outer membrane receptor protein involved in Fe transport
MGTLRLRSAPRVLLRRTVAGALVLGRAIANAADPTDETQPEQVIVTEGRYAQSATRTLEPVLDIPRNVQVVPRQLIEDRAIDDPQDAIQNVSAVMRGGSPVGEGEAFTIRYCALQPPQSRSPGDPDPRDRFCYTKSPAQCFGLAKASR